MSIKSIQERIGVTSDGIWGPKSQAKLEELVSTSEYKLYIDFDKFRELFKLSKVSQKTVENLNTLFEEFNSLATKGSCNPLYVAYMLATTWHETGHTMEPVKEKGSWKYLSKYDTGKLAKALGNTPATDGDGQKYAGRGYVQITGKGNYQKFSSLVGEDLVANPDLTLRPVIAARILVEGSLKGMFTGRGIPHYVKRGTLAEYTEARRVINGTDKAQDIAKHAMKFLECLV